MNFRRTLIILIVLVGIVAVSVIASHRPNTALSPANDRSSSPNNSNAEVVTAPASVFGKYRGGVACRSSDSYSCAVTVPQDEVDIVPIENNTNAANIDVAMSFTNGHVCSLQGVGAWSGDRFVIRDERLSSPDNPCILEVIISQQFLTMKDEGLVCRELYCGTRGTFDGGWFEKVSP